MKSTTTVTRAYEIPDCMVIEIDIQELICTSPTGYNEPYDEGDTSGWYNNQWRAEK